MSGRCRWNILDGPSGVRYDVPGCMGGAVPGCMGGAVSGPSGCTCSTERSREDLEERVEALEEMVRNLTSESPALPSVRKGGL